jgi:sulfur-oxidizing protein SoxZ
MAEIGKVRIRIPSSIKRGDVVRVRSLVIHPIKIVQRDKAGKPIDKDYHFINKVIATYNSQEILQANTTQSISENPFFSFAFKPTEPGMLRITFLDTHGGKYEGTAEIKFA